MKRVLLYTPILFMAVFIAYMCSAPKFTYIANVDIPGPLGELANSYIREYNTNVHGLLLRKSIRPITIKMGSLEPGDLGLSMVNFLNCVIVIDTHRDWAKVPNSFKITLIHEIGHCYLFPHNEKDPSDIMYPYENPMQNQDSINKFYPVLEKAAGL